MTDDTLLLMSGGVDSSVLALHLTRHGYTVIPFYVDYGHVPRERERQCVRAVARHLGLSEPLEVSLPALSAIRTVADTGDTLWSNTYFPQRNLFLLTTAAMFAEAKQAAYVAVGICRGSEVSFPDTTPLFIQYANTALAVTSETEVIAPFADWSKLDIVRYGLRHAFPFELTYSCTRRSDIPCGVCRSCEEREVLEAELEALEIAKENRRTYHAHRKSPGVD